MAYQNIPVTAELLTDGFVDVFTEFIAFRNLAAQAIAGIASDGSSGTMAEMMRQHNEGTIKA